MGLFKSKRVERSDKFIQVSTLKKLLSYVDGDNIISVDEYGDLVIFSVNTQGKASPIARIDIASEKLIQVEG